MAVDIVARALAIKNAGGTGETIDYNQITNKPQINNIELVGNKTLDELGIQAKGDYALVDDVDAQISELQRQIPTNVSQLNNDSGYITVAVNNLENYTPTGDLADVATSGSYNDLSNKPTIPTNTSQLTNDSDYTTNAYVDSLVGNINSILATLTTVEDGGN